LCGCSLTRLVRANNCLRGWGPRLDDAGLWTAISSEVLTEFDLKVIGVYHLLKGRISSQAATWSTPTQLRLSHPLPSSDQHQRIFTEPSGAATLSAHVSARSGFSLSGNETLASCGQEEVFLHESALC